MKPYALALLLTQVIPTSPVPSQIRLLHANFASAPTTALVEEVLATYTLPANTLDADGKTLRVTCFGTTAANANTKIGRIRFGGIGGGTAVSITTASSGAFWNMAVYFVRTGASAEIANSLGVAGGAALANGNTYAVSTAATIDIVCTGTTATAAADLTKTGFLVELVSQ